MENNNNARNYVKKDEERKALSQSYYGEHERGVDEGGIFNRVFDSSCYNSVISHQHIF